MTHMKHRAPKETKEHTTVLLDETVSGLQLAKGDTAIDATVGSGGHAQELARAVGKKGTLVVLDVDQHALDETRKKLTDMSGTIIYVHGNFRNLRAHARESGIEEADGIVFDLGWRSEQLASGRGLSFNADEPLDMSLGDGNSKFTAKDIIADWDEVEIAAMIRRYGEERFSGRIARAIVEARRRTPLETSRALAQVIQSAVPSFYRHGRIHPATRTFQALRIAVNDELEALTAGLTDALELLGEGGRVAVISFHSLEDRIVKHMFRQAESDGKGRRITKKPIQPAREERTSNPRSRSAKLRIFEKHHDAN